MNDLLWPDEGQRETEIKTQRERDKHTQIKTNLHRQRDAARQTHGSTDR